MGKNEEDQVLSSSEADAVDFVEGNVGGGGSCGLLWRVFSVRCVMVLIFSLAVVVSAVFWLPPFVRFGDRGDLDLNGWTKAEIAGSFRLHKPLQLLKSNIVKLEYDIFEEIGVPDTKVAVLSLRPVSGTNWTSVVFQVLPFVQGSDVSSAGLSILRSTLISLVLEQSNLHLTQDVFGVPYFFQLLRFPGGITVAPQQDAFLLQKTQTLFNFTLNYSIYQIQENLDVLKHELKSCLKLRGREDLYIQLTNLNGSTVEPPSIVQASVIAQVGNVPLTAPRLKQLAQAITSSPAKNLGLNHTVFGKVKQIQLSSYLQHSLGSDSVPPSPAPYSNHHHHHHHHGHHHHHHHHHHDHRHHEHNPELPVLPPTHPPLHSMPLDPGHQHHHVSSPPSSSHSGSLSRNNVGPAPKTSPSLPVRTHGVPPAPISSPFPGPPSGQVSFSHVQPPSQAASVPSKSKLGATSHRSGTANSQRKANLVLSPSPSPLPSSCCEILRIWSPWFLAFPVMWLLQG